mgnify:CR=1 FL=1
MIGANLDKGLRLPLPADFPELVKSADYFLGLMKKLPSFMVPKEAGKKAKALESRRLPSAPMQR